MKIVPITIPTPFYVGSVNVYLIKEDPLTLIDVGPKTADAYSALINGLSNAGVNVADIKRILLTHAHEDHCGLSKRVRDSANDAKVFVHKWETGHLFGRLSKEIHKNLLLSSGVPDFMCDEMQADYKNVSLLTDSLNESEFQTIYDNDVFEFEKGMLRVIHTPGHTPGSCSFIRDADRTIFCGDCALKRITPNPILSPDPVNSEKRFQALGEYLVSLARIRNEAPTKLFTGHGVPIVDFETTLTRYRRAIDERQRQIVEAIIPNALTAWDVAQKIFPEAVQESIHRFLAVSETIAHLDFAFSEGKITKEFAENREFFRTNFQ
ncbi:MAG: MBL fold metallo-hydrolase [Pyrinomonadaceae bacterium]